MKHVPGIVKLSAYRTLIFLRLNAAGSIMTDAACSSSFANDISIDFVTNPWVVPHARREASAQMDEVCLAVSQPDILRLFDVDVFQRQRSNHDEVGTPRLREAPRSEAVDAQR